MLITTALGKFRWIENWITIPDSPLGRTNGRTHGVAVLPSGDIVIFHQADPGVLIYSPRGELRDAWGHFPGAHGLTLVEEDGEAYFWLTDEVLSRVVKTRMDGTVLAELGCPSHPAYENASYIPTWVAVAEHRFGGCGDIWVADGYGASLVHRFDSNGIFLGTLDGTEGGGRFNCPHGLYYEARGAEPCFVIADRGNHRFQAYSPDGRFLRVFGEDTLHSPDTGVPWGKHLLVPELVAGLTVLDHNEKLVDRIGFQSDASELQGWPNERSNLKPGLFNSPHSAAVDPQGNIYVVEWITGGRVTKLEAV
jgi:hypothetical protein